MKAVSKQWNITLMVTDDGKEPIAMVRNNGSRASLAAIFDHKLTTLNQGFKEKRYYTDDEIDQWWNNWLAVKEAAEISKETREVKPSDGRNGGRL